MTSTAVLGVLPAWAPATAPVDVYTRRCEPSGLLIRFDLLRLGIAHRCVDVVGNPEAAMVLAGLPHPVRDRLPVVSVDGEWLTRPTLDELQDALRRHQLL